MSSEERLEKSLTENNDSLIDTFTDFPNRQTIRFQIWNRQLGLLGLSYFSDLGDFFAETMRSHRRKSREESVLALGGKREHEEAGANLATAIISQGKKEKI